MNGLSIKNISKTYSNGVKALDNISLEIPNGMFGLLGPNGAGKSTLMRTLATLQEVDGGTIKLDEVNLLNDKPRIRAVLGYLPQEFGLYPKISAEVLLDHLALLKGISNHAKRNDRVTTLLKQTNLHDVRNRNLGTFSGGMKQRFGIAQALLSNPRLLIVDEPTAGLDPEERNRFHNLLSEVGEETVVILSTHIVEDIKEMCPRMAIIKEGKVLLQGRPSELIKQLEGKVYQKQIAKHSLDEYEKNYRVISKRRYLGSLIIKVYADQDVSPEFEPVKPTFEDVYFSQI